MRQDWKDANITATFKKESRRDCGNYRGISLLSIAGKIMARIILNRINRKITPNILPETQCGLEVEEAPWTWSAARSKTRRSNYQSPGDLISFWRVILYRLFSSFSHCLSVCPWLDFGLPPRTGCVVSLSVHGWTSAFFLAQVVWCHWGKIEPFSATLAQDGLAECDQPGKNPLKYSAMARNWTRAMERTDSEIRSFSHWTTMTDCAGLT